MNGKSLSSFSRLLLAVLAIAAIFFLAKNPSSDLAQETQTLQEKEVRYGTEAAAGILSLTEEKRVVAYVRKHEKLPDYYLTKSEARNQGWVASDGNLCDILPGKAIGGDKFQNREGKLPKLRGRIYYEADINYDCGHRGADRLIFSNDGLIYITRDHYASFQKP